MKSNSTKFTINGKEHEIIFKYKSILLDGIKINLKEIKDKDEKIYGLNCYKLPVDGSEVRIYQRAWVGTTVVYEGKNVKTGEDYIPKPTPKWIVAFLVLYIINMAAVLGGALGGAINCGLYCLTNIIALNEKRKHPFLCCLGIYFGATIVEFIIAILIKGMVSQ